MGQCCRDITALYQPCQAHFSPRSQALAWNRLRHRTRRAAQLGAVSAGLERSDVLTEHRQSRRHLRLWARAPDSKVRAPEGVVWTRPAPCAHLSVRAAESAFRIEPPVPKR